MRNIQQTILFFYSLLFLATSAWFLFLDINQSSIGLFLLLWTFLSFAAVLWVFESVLYQNAKDTDLKGNIGSLASSLIQNMEEQKNKSISNKAASVFSSFNILICILIFIYFMWAGVVSLFPDMNNAQQNLDEEIQLFFAKHTASMPAPNIFSHYFYSSLSLWLGIMFIILQAVFLAQIFVFVARFNQALIWLSGTVFLTSFFVVSITEYVTAQFISLPIYGYGINNINILQNMNILPQGEFSSFQVRALEYGWAGVTFIYLIGIVVFTHLLLRAHKSAEHVHVIIVGFIILGMMAYADFAFSSSTKLWALWFSGWVSIAILSVRTQSRSKKSYTLYQ